MKIRQINAPKQITLWLKVLCNPIRMTLLKVISDWVNHFTIFGNELLILFKNFELIYLWKLDKLVLLVIRLIFSVLSFSMRWGIHMSVIIIIILIYYTAFVVIKLLLFFSGFNMVSKKHCLVSLIITFFSFFVLALFSNHWGWFFLRSLINIK